MLDFDASKNCQDPYKNFKFRLKWNGRTVAGFHNASALSREHSRYEPITLERGVTHDVEFEQWAARSSKSKGDGQTAPSINVAIEAYNEAGQVTLAYKLYRCRASSYQALPELDAGSNAVAIDSLKLENEGWERQ